MSAPLEPRLVALALRRALQPALLLPLCAVALVLALVDWRAGPGVAELSAPAARGLARQAVWLGGLAFLLPAVCLHAARVVPRWREGDAAWLAPRRLGPLAGLTSSWCGAALGALVGLAILALAGEWAAAGDAPTWRPEGELRPSTAAALPGGAGWRWTLPDPGERAPGGSRLRVAFDLQALAGPGAEVRLVARREAPGAAQAAVGGRFTRAAELEIELPSGSGAVALELHRIGAGAALAPAGARVALLVPATSERGGVLAFCGRLALALAGALGLALGLGAWVSPPSAAILTGLALAAPAVSPAAGLAGALDALGRGLAPPAAGAQALLGALLFTALGLGLARAGERLEAPR